MDDLFEIGALGWRQASLIFAAGPLAQTFPGRPALGDRDLLVVVSHDCDVVNQDIDKEPYVELLVAREHIGGPRGDLTFGKNPRTLDVDVEGKTYEISIHERFSVDRRALLGHVPDGILDRQNILVLRRWVGQRYLRSAFPDRLNERIREGTQKIYDRLKKHGRDLSGLYLLVSDDELPPEEPYRIVLIATMLAEDYAISAKRVDTMKLVDNIASLLDECEGVTCDDGELRSETDVSLDDLRSLKRWDADSLSFRPKPGGPSSPEGH
jgi:hypothetical protein